jgi:hypothetical protein
LARIRVFEIRPQDAGAPGLPKLDALPEREFCAVIDRGGLGDAGKFSTSQLLEQGGALLMLVWF